VLEANLVVGIGRKHEKFERKSKYGGRSSKIATVVVFSVCCEEKERIRKI